MPTLVRRTVRGILAAAIFCSTVVTASASRAAGDDALVGNFFPYRAFEQLPSTPIDVGGGRLDVAFGPGELELSHETVLAWVTRCVRAVADYYGRLPDPNARLLIVPVSGSGIRGGTTYGYRGAASRILLGRDTTQRQLARDWVLVHELVHQGFPSVSDEHHWMEEGLATYVEPIARAQAGELSVQKVWGDLVEGLPKGLPQAGDRGLDRTPTWGRTYWGGALFYLLAEIEIRRRTDNHRGLQDALRAIVTAGGNVSRSWPVDKVLATGDAGTGTHVLAELYNRMKDKPVSVDLADIWRQLGVSMQGASLNFDDAAPLSSIRRAITAPLPSRREQ
ncbi:MAG TPA: hypothetical protein VMH26_11420 [Burkholderiales bacterium]|nr:hypothetical protein [Burkholderiales bacterium]